MSPRLRLPFYPRSSYALLLVLAITLGVTVGLTPSFTSATRVDNRAQYISPDGSMAAVLAEAPFKIRQPTLPPGFELLSVQYNPPVVTDGKLLFAVDFHYADAAGNQFHVWQTNIPNLAEYGKDPADESQGVAATISGSTWRLVRINDARGHVSALSRRLSDGVTISIDSTIDERVIETIAALIE